MSAIKSCSKHTYNNNNNNKKHTPNSAKKCYDFALDVTQFECAEKGKRQINPIQMLPDETTNV